MADKEFNKTEVEKIYETAVDILKNINTELKDHKLLGTINTKMVGVVKDLNDVRISLITGKEPEE